MGWDGMGVAEGSLWHVVYRSAAALRLRAAARRAQGLEIWAEVEVEGGLCWLLAAACTCRCLRRPETTHCSWGRPPLQLPATYCGMAGPGSGCGTSA